ncbi:MAG: helix-turn-helix transcriptional regulator [Mollicutes bacterium]|nr:helix-turn-helix transcriptional regulator [Mollicutes bacterium]
MIVGSRLKQARIRNNFTQADLAKELGLSKSSISLYENEIRNPKLETIIELMYLLGVDANYLLGSDVIVEIDNNKVPKYHTLTNEEMNFINELRKDKMLYNILFSNPKRGIEIIKQRIG